MKTKIVTAFYTGIGGHPFYGHEPVARHERYLHSLRVLNNLQNEIICYCDERQFDLLKNHCDEFQLNNVTLKVSNLIDMTFANKMIEIKEKTDNFKFYHEIDWNKFYLLDKEYDESHDYIYWIDVGISHRGLFLLKYNPNADKITGLSRDYFNYDFTGLFNENFIGKLNNWVEDKLINLSYGGVSHQYKDMVRVLNINKVFSHMSIGGFIGGNVKNLRWFIDEFYNVGNEILNNDVIVNHEAIFALISQDNPNFFKTFIFNTWYHDDFWKTTPHFDNESIKNKVHFVHFFEKELNI